MLPEFRNHPKRCYGLIPEFGKGRQMLPQYRNSAANAPEVEERALYSVVDAARLLSISRNQAWKLVWSGDLRSVRIGSRRLVPAEAIPEFIASLPSGQPEERVAA